MIFHLQPSGCELLPAWGKGAALFYCEKKKNKANLRRDWGISCAVLHCFICFYRGYQSHKKQIPGNIPAFLEASQAAWENLQLLLWKKTKTKFVFVWQQVQCPCKCSSLEFLVLGQSAEKHKRGAKQGSFPWRVTCSQSRICQLRLCAAGCDLQALWNHKQGWDCLF